jgi:predicted GNAT family acetyltransferase
MAETVEHQESRKRFVLTTDGLESELTYRRHGDTIVFEHTGVPEELQHRGLANQLAEAGLAYAVEQQLKVDPQCRFMEVYLQRHRQYDHLLVGKASAIHSPQPMAGGTR